MDITKENQARQSSEPRMVMDRQNIRTKDISKSRIILKRILIALLVLVIGLIVAAAGGYIWALMSTDTSLAARGIIWGGSHYDDWKRFPSRVVNASVNPVTFDVEKSDIFDDFTIDDKSLETYLEASNTKRILCCGKPYSAQFTTL